MLKGIFGAVVGAVVTSVTSSIGTEVSKKVTGKKSKTTAKDIAGKVWAIFFPIMAFVVSGYEHCVANMYYIPAGIFAASNEVYVQAAMDTYGYTAAQLQQLTWSSMLVNNLLPVTLGNIVGGMIFVGLPLYLIHGAKIREEEHHLERVDKKKSA